MPPRAPPGIPSRIVRASFVLERHAFAFLVLLLPRCSQAGEAGDVQRRRAHGVFRVLVQPQVRGRICAGRVFTHSCQAEPLSCDEGFREGLRVYVLSRLSTLATRIARTTTAFSLHRFTVLISEPRHGHHSHQDSRGFFELVSVL